MQALSLTAPMRFVCGSPRSQPTTRATYAHHSPVILSPTNSPTMNSQALLASYARPRRRSTRSSVSSLISSVLQLAGNSGNNVNDSAARDGKNEDDASMAFEKRTVTSTVEGCVRKSLLSETLKSGAREKTHMLKGIRINTTTNGESRQASSIEDHVNGATPKRSLKFGNCPHVVRDNNGNTDGGDTSSQATRTHHDNTDASSIASISTVGSWKKSKHHFSPPPAQSLLTKHILGEAGINKDEDNSEEEDEEDEEDGYLEDDEDDDEDDEEEDEDDEDDEEEEDEEEVDEEEEDDGVEGNATVQDSQPSLDPVTIKNTNANAGVGSVGMAGTPVKILRRIISRTSLTTATTCSEQEPMTPSSHSTCTPPGKHLSMRRAKSLPYSRFTSGDETNGDVWASNALFDRHAKSGANVTRRRKGIPIPSHASCSHHQHRRRSRHHRHRRSGKVSGNDSANIIVGVGANGERPDEDSLFWPVSI